MHAGDRKGAKAFDALRSARKTSPGFAMLESVGAGTLDPETVARQYVQQALDSDRVPKFTVPQVKGAESELKSLGVETLPLTNTKTVKFRQTLNKIPVYSSLITVELDENNEILAINSALGAPKNVDSLAKIAPAEVVKKVAKQVGHGLGSDVSPRLNYYFDQKKGRWRLVYIIEDVPMERPKGDSKSSFPRVMDFVIDAHTGALVAQVPRNPSAATPFEEDAVDGLGKTRRIRGMKESASRTLQDGLLNIRTHDFKFGDPDLKEHLLPGGFASNPPDPWGDGAISAHANAAVVASFLRDTLMRNNIDNVGGALVSTVNCVVAAESSGGNSWLNAFWTPVRRQMVYGQTKHNGKLRSLAVFLDVVGHEMFHGVTDLTSRLEYARQSGALNESYSDIFGILIANSDKPDIGQWGWDLGPGLRSDGRPLRDLSKPSRCNQPEKMSQYRNLPNTQSGDWGGVHINSGIHNFAAYKIITAKKDGAFVFKPAEFAAVFYIALTQHLTRTSDFSASRRAVTLAARTLFRNDPEDVQKTKLAAIAKGFEAVGIKEPAN
jgi:Zn-dependent metalloprotease